MENLEDAAAGLARAGSANVAAALAEQGLRDVVLRGPVPVCGPREAFAGPARTLRYLPRREDVPAGPNGAVSRAIVEDLAAGEVLVVDALGCRDAAVLGDMMAARAKFRGAAGAVIDGSVRDTDGITALGFPVYALGTHPAPPATHLVAWEADAPVQCGGRLVRPGDWTVADGDGVVVVPGGLLAKVLPRAVELTERDQFSQQLLAEGYRLDDAYPLPADQEEAYARFRAARTDP